MDVRTDGSDQNKNGTEFRTTPSRPGPTLIWPGPDIHGPTVHYRTKTAERSPNFVKQVNQAEKLEWMVCFGNKTVLFDCSKFGF